MKICKNCKTEFSGNKCRICANAIIKRWRLNNPEKSAAASKNWKSNNKERVKVRDRLYKQKNKEKQREQLLIRKTNRRLKLKGKLSPDIKNRLFSLQKGKCPCCNLPLGDNYHLDHIIPIALGGLNEDSNMQLLRAQCNLQKHKKHPIDFMQSRGFLL